MAAGGRIVAYTGTDEHGEQPDLVFDPQTVSWIALPPDPLSPSFDRSMLWTGQELVLVGRPLGANPGSEKPAVARAAAFDPDTGSWRQLPKSSIVQATSWILVGGRLVSPINGSRYFGYHGWILDATTNTWIELPPLDGEQLVTGQTVVAAGSDLLVFGGTRWTDLHGTLLNDAWIWSAP